MIVSTRRTEETAVTEPASWPGELSPADLDVLAAPGGSVAAALAWVEMVLDGRIADSWPATGPRFRLHLTRHWAWRHRFRLHDAGHDPLKVAAGLADDGPGHRLWPAFARSQQPPDAGPTGSPGWVSAGPPEPLAPDLEVVRLMAAECAGTGRVVSPLTLVLRFGPGGWLVEGHGRTPAPEPGWPPSQ
jgi:hypothetical protein